MSDTVDGEVKVDIMEDTTKETSQENQIKQGKLLKFQFTPNTGPIHILLRFHHLSLTIDAWRPNEVIV